MIGSPPRIACLDCGHDTAYSPKEAACPRCGSEWREARYAYGEIAARLPVSLRGRLYGVWRYAELLPVQNPSSIVTLGEGNTPLFNAGNLSLMLGRPNVYVKDERQGPTASFKDRQATLTISALKEAGITDLVVASTGNVAISYSAFCARAGVKLWAFLTSLVPAEKMREVAMYGSQVIKVSGTYDQAKKLAAEFAKQRGLYLDRGTRAIPNVEAMKTIAFEIAEQMGRMQRAAGLDGHATRPSWRAPDWYVQAVSGGIGPIGVLKGFWELKEMGLTDRVPNLAAIQTEGCAPMAHAFREGRDVAEPIAVPRTNITTLSTGDPGRSYTLLRERTRDTRSVFESVSDEEAFRAMHVLAKLEGIACEPAAACAFAGLIKLARSGVIRPDDTVVVNCSGHTVSVEKQILGDNWSLDVTLPKQPGPLQAPMKAPQEGLMAALSRLDRRTHTIAIVEDNADARRLLRRILQARGEYVIYEAENGRAGVDLALREHPDLILLDLMMPEMDGFQVLDALKADVKTSTIPVIVVSAKELTAEDSQRLGGRIETVLQKGSFLDEELYSEIVEKLS